MKIFNKVSTVILSLAFILGITGPTTTFAAGPATINLGTAANYVILAKTAITTTGSHFNHRKYRNQSGLFN